MADGKSSELHLTEEVIQGAFFDIPDHNHVWASFGTEDAPLARAALLRAEQLRREQADPGDAYLAGIVELRGAQTRQRTINHVVETLDIETAIDSLLDADAS